MNLYAQPRLKPGRPHPCNRSGCETVLETEMWFCRRCWNFISSKTQEELNVAYVSAQAAKDWKLPRFAKALHAARIEAAGGAERAEQFRRNKQRRESE